jgi:hypothetical protein
MPGTLVITTLSDGTNSTSATNCIQGSAKAWVNFNGTGTVAIRASYNVSSITDNGTGDYTVNLTTAMPNANYAVSAASSSGGSSITATMPFTSGYTFSAPSTTAFRIFTGNNTVAVDSAAVSVAVFS